MKTPDSDANNGRSEADSGTPQSHAVKWDGVDLAEALRLLSQAGIRVSRDSQPVALQQVIDGLCTLSSQDGLTGLANRRIFNEALRRQIDRSARTGEIFGLLLIDIDYFKEVNDQHGHLAGDAVLRTIARMIEDDFRSVDTVARFGGEEFVVILPNVSAAFLRQVAERVRAKIAAATIEVSPGKVVQVTVSIGTVCSRGHMPLDAKTLIEHADRKLYEAKRHGRNRVCCEPETDAELTPHERAELQRVFDSLDTNA